MRSLEPEFGIKNISIDLRDCTNRDFWYKARLGHRLTMFAVNVNMLPHRFSVSNDAKTAADEAKNAVKKLNENCKLKRGDLGDLLRDGKVREDFVDGLELLTDKH